MSTNKNTSTNEQQVVSRISSNPFTMQITHNGEITEVPAHQTRDMRYEFSRAIPEDAEWVVLQQEVNR